MPRYHVVFADHNTKEFESKLVRASCGVDAILSHPWIADIYKDSYIYDNFRQDTEEATCEAIYNFTNWMILCVNLDEEIMKDLNGGGSNASCSMVQS